MSLSNIEIGIHWLGGLSLLLTLATLLFGIFRGLRRPPHRISGRFSGWLRSPLFYILASVGYFGIIFLLWKPLPILFSPTGRSFLLIVGSILFFPGIFLAVWGRLALGKDYFVSTSQAGQLFSGQHLVKRGPYGFVRHPMYFGLILVGLGGLLLYQNWAFLFVALGFFGFGFRARREEQVLAVEFGQEWVDYCHFVPRMLPFSSPEQVARLRSHIHPSVSALFEIGVLFIPAIPAFLWVWPNLNGSENLVIQGLVYVYIFAGALCIGLRRWNWDQLGVNWKGLWLSLACALVILVGRLMIILSITWAANPPELSILRVAVDIFYYFILVGLVEELLFRGLVYRLFEDWRGVRWAIWGSSLGFGLWHVFGQGWIAGITTMVIGLVFALIRWRAGGIAGLVLLHGLWDLQAIWLVSDRNIEILSPDAYSISNWFFLWLGTMILVLVPLYLGFVYPRFQGNKAGFLQKAE